MAVLTTTAKKRNAWIDWLDHCPGRNGRYINHLFFGRTIGGVADVWVPAFIALEACLRAGGYTPESAWAYNFRGIGGASCSCTAYTRCSLHGQGTTIDIDPKKNPYIATPVFDWDDTAFTPEQIGLIEGIQNTKGEQMWFWGGRWRSIKDYMHFEPNVDPGSADVDWTTVPTNGGYLGMLAPCQLGDEGEHVGALQAMITASGFDAGTIDNRYGEKTSAGLLALRKSLGSSATSGDVFDKYAYEQVHQAHIRRFAAGGSGSDQIARAAAAAAQATADTAAAGANRANASLDKIRSE